MRVTNLIFNLFVNNYKSNYARRAVIFFLIIYIGISQLILPAFKVNDFLFFSRWSMFGATKYRVYDLTWDGGQTYLFRDHRAEYMSLNKNLRILFHRAKKNDIAWLRKNLSVLYVMCRCKKINLVQLDSTYREHILLRKPANTIQTISL